MPEGKTAVTALCIAGLAASLLAACAGGPAGRSGQGGPGLRERPGGGDPALVAPTAARLPPVPWRDNDAPAAQAGQLYWSDVPRDRVISARWSAPPAAAVQGLIVVLPALAQGDKAPTTLVDGLNAAGFAVLTIGHPGNDDSVWQTPEARNADFAEAARRQYAATQARLRAADVRFVLDELQRVPPPWLPPPALQRIGVTGIGLGAQTAQWLAGEQMAASPPAAEPRIRAAALLGPYVGFEGPGVHQRYGAVRTPLLIAYGSKEVESYGLGMPPQQRRAMVEQLVNAPVVEVRLPVSLADVFGSARPPPTTRDGVDTRASPSRREAGGGGGQGGAGGTSVMGGPPGSDPRTPPAASRDAEAARIALHFSTVAFFEAELLRSADARDWLVGPHPAPVQWSVRPAGAAAAVPR